MIELPILICTTDDGTFCKAHSISRAECEMEPIDVRNGIWRAFDASGAPLKLLVTKTPTAIGLFTFERVSILEDERPPKEAPNIRQELAAYLHEIGAGGDELYRQTFRELLAFVHALD